MKALGLKLAAILILWLLFMASLAVGYIDQPFWQLLDRAWQGDVIAMRILVDLRLPRAILGLAVGAALGMAGAALQGLLRNPLAEPSLLGVSGGAALGAVVMLYTGLAGWGMLMLPLGGMVGTGLAVALVFVLARRSSDTTLLILAGVAVSSLTGAMISLVMNWTRNAYALQEIVFWMMGSLADRSMRDVVLAVPFILLGLLLLYQTRVGLQALSLGEDTAHTMGVDLPQLRLKVLLGTAFAVGAAVSVAGSIGFIGLVAPHLMRPWVKSSPMRLLLVSAWAGAVLLLLSDISVRLMYSQGQELKLGVVTAVIGAPFFFWLLVRVHRRGYV